MDINVIIETKYLENNRDSLHLLFYPNDELIYLPESFDMYDVLTEVGIFKSKSEAKKNWTRSKKEIPWGFNSWLGIGKLKVNLWIWKPVKN